MLTKPSKLAIIGFDSMTIGLVQRFIREGRLPNFERLLSRGVASEAFCSPPPGTASNWNTIVTGAHVGTHQVVGLSVHAPQDLRDQSSGFFSYHCKAERLWEAAERAGKRTAILRYTTSWPPTIKNGVQVCGFGDPDWNLWALVPRSVYATRKLPSRLTWACSPPPGAEPQSVEIEVAPAEDWQAAPDSSLPLLESKLVMRPVNGETKAVPFLIAAHSAEGYDTLHLYRDKSDAQPIASLHVGQWSPWLELRFAIDGEAVAGFARLKLMDLSPDGRTIHLYHGQIFPARGWASPSGLEADIMAAAGPYYELSAVCNAYDHGWIDEPTYLQEYQFQVEWLSKSAQHLLSTQEWDIFATQWHGIDHTDHSFLSGLVPGHPQHELFTQVVARTYELADEYLGAVLEQCDDSTLIVVTSDHGHTERHGDWLRVNDVLAEAGLLQYLSLELEPDQKDTGGYRPKGMREIDWEHTKAVLGHDGMVYVNLRSRYVHGCVPDDAYESVVCQVIRTLESVPHPNLAGRRRFQYVWSREDAEVFGFRGDMVGDVIFFYTLSSLGGHHGNFHATRDRVGSMRACTIFAGPGIREGIVRGKPMHLVDIAPTAAFLLDIPVPAQSEGAVLWDIMQDPDKHAMRG